MRCLLYFDFLIIFIHFFCLFTADGAVSFEKTTTNSSKGRNPNALKADIPFQPAGKITEQPPKSSNIPYVNLNNNGNMFGGARPRNTYQYVNFPYEKSQI